MNAKVLLLVICLAFGILYVTLPVMWSYRKSYALSQGQSRSKEKKKRKKNATEDLTRAIIMKVVSFVWVTKTWLSYDHSFAFVKGECPGLPHCVIKWNHFVIK